MPLYITPNDGECIQATHNADFVRKLKANSHMGRGLSDKQFMKQTAARVFETTGCKVKTKSATTFVQGLVEAQLLKISSDKDTAEEQQPK